MGAVCPGRHVIAIRSASDRNVPPSAGCITRVIVTAVRRREFVGLDPEFTPRVLEVLRRYGISATFNLLGFNALNHPEEVRAVVAAGHEIGNHTFTHQDLAQETPEGTLLQLRRGRQSILDVAGPQPLRWFRPPRGRLTGVAARYAAELEPAAIRDYMHRHLHPGAIVALHDGIGRGTFLPSAAFARELASRREVELKALPSVLEQSFEDGYRFVTVSELVTLDQGPDAGEPVSTPSVAPDG
jgi:peptidoglycan/xylan/chitin deacetylase (PgdA/CDA1 family)